MTFTFVDCITSHIKGFTAVILIIKITIFKHFIFNNSKLCIIKHYLYKIIKYI